MDIQKKVTKVVIPAAGFGTNLLPISKAVPKEMLPILDLPAIHYIVQEAINAGLHDILIIINNNKKVIMDYFGENYMLNNLLQTKNKMNLISKFVELKKQIKVQFAIQDNPIGLGDSILCAQSFVGNEPFAVILPDDLLIPNKQEKRSGIKQCLDCYYANDNKSVVGVKEVALKDVTKYGIIDIKKSKKNTKDYFDVKAMIEKPKVEETPSQYAMIGRYVFNPSIFNYLSKVQLSPRGEIEIVDAIEQELKKHGVFACNLHGDRYDVGNKLGWMRANIEIGLKNEEFKEYLQSIIK